MSPSILSPAPRDRSSSRDGAIECWFWRSPTGRWSTNSSRAAALPSTTSDDTDRTRSAKFVAPALSFVATPSPRPRAELSGIRISSLKPAAASHVDRELERQARGIRPGALDNARRRSSPRCSYRSRRETVTWTAGRLHRTGACKARLGAVKTIQRRVSDDELADVPYRFLIPLVAA